MLSRFSASVQLLLVVALLAPLASPRSASATDGSWRGRGPAQSGWGPSAIYDPARQRMVVYGGQSGPISGNSDEIAWQLTLQGTPSWTALTVVGMQPNAPFGRQSQSAIYDPVRDRMIVFGGLGVNFWNDVWAFSLATHTWTQLMPSGLPPAARQGHTAIYDPIRDRMIVFGGAIQGNTDKNDVWALSLGASPAWTQLTPSGTPPIARGWH